MRKTDQTAALSQQLLTGKERKSISRDESPSSKSRPRSFKGKLTFSQRNSTCHCISNRQFNSRFVAINHRQELVSFATVKLYKTSVLNVHLFLRKTVFIGTSRKRYL